MCGIFGQKLAALPSYRKMLSDKARKQLTIGIGDIAVIQTQTELFEAVFGLCPSHLDKKMWFYNARADYNKNDRDDPKFSGPFEIGKNPAFKSSFSRRRCIVPVSHFFEGPWDKKLCEPYLVERKDKGTFYLGGMWDTWTDRDTRESVDTFAIITTAATPLMKQIQHHRSPLVLTEKDIPAWLDPSTKKLDPIFNANSSAELQCYLSSEIVKKRTDDPEVLEPKSEIFC